MISVSDYGQVLFSVGKGFLALWTEIFIFGVTLREHIALDNACIPQAGRFITSCANDKRFRYGGSSSSKDIFLHGRHLPFCAR